MFMSRSLLTSCLCQIFHPPIARHEKFIKPKLEYAQGQLWHMHQSQSMGWLLKVYNHQLLTRYPSHSVNRRDVWVENLYCCHWFKHQQSSSHTQCPPSSPSILQNCPTNDPSHHHWLHHYQLGKYSKLHSVWGTPTDFTAKCQCHLTQIFLQQD